MSVANTFNNPALQQKLNLCKSGTVIYIGPDPPDAASFIDAAHHAYLHVRSLQEAKNHAAGAHVTNTSESTQALPMEQDHDPVIAVVQLGADEHSIDSTLGHAIRLFPDHLLVSCVSPTLGDERFFAFGFQRCHLTGGDAADNVSPRWYEYRMCNYKSPPDWLNARFWANPERFDLVEDPDLYSEEE